MRHLRTEKIVLTRVTLLLVCDERPAAVCRAVPAVHKARHTEGRKYELDRSDLGQLQQGFAALMVLLAKGEFKNEIGLNVRDHSDISDSIEPVRIFSGKPEFLSHLPSGLSVTSQLSGDVRSLSHDTTANSRPRSLGVGFRPL